MPTRYDSNAVYGRQRRARLKTIGSRVVVSALACAITLASIPFAQRVGAQIGIEGKSTRKVADYILGPQDKVRVKVYAWRPSRDEVYEWKALNDVYTVGASGQISLPLIGEVDANGLNLTEVAASIGEQMKSKLGLVEPPHASIEIVECRPFFILGNVAKPGQFAYRPSLTIVQALAIAGGLARLNEYEAIRFDRDLIANSGERTIFAGELNALAAKRIRLDAEISGASDITFPDHLVRQLASLGQTAVITGEKDFFATHYASFEAKSKSLVATVQMLRNEIVVTEQAMTGQDANVAAASKELARFEALLAKKLTTNNRRLEASRNLMQAENDRFRLTTTLAGLRQKLVQAEMDVRTLTDTRVNQAAVDARATQLRIDELNWKIKTADTLAQDGTATSLHLASIDGPQGKKRPIFTIIRTVGEAIEEIRATETTLVKPGDTIKVEMPRGPANGTDVPLARRASADMLPTPTRN